MVSSGDSAIDVTVGAGGTAGPATQTSKGGQGSNSGFGTITALGGGYATMTLNENAGGSGAGGSSGGSAGRYLVKGGNTVTLNNSGTVLGGLA